jgi:hypothetical protein
MKKIITLTFILICQICFADGDFDRFNVQAKVIHQDDTFLFTASFQTPLTACQAYRYLTDYEAAKKVPGVTESKPTRISSNKVLVERSAEEKVLFFKVKLHTLIEYTEQPIKGTEFIQIKGDSKRFSGKWFVEPSISGSVIRHEGVLEPDSHLPMFVIKYFIENRLEDRFKTMAKLSAERKTIEVACN